MIELKKPLENHSLLFQEAYQKINDKSLTVGVIGLGYVGLPLAIEFAKKKIKTYGIDVSAEKVAMLQKGENYIQDINSDWVKECVDSGYFSAYNDFAMCANCDAIFICVPTPFTPNKDPDVSHIVHSSEEAQKFMKKGQTFILKSTTFPGTTEKYVQPVLEKSGLKTGSDYFLAFSPERIDPGNKVWNTANTPIVVGGVNEESTILSVMVNELIIEKVVPVSSPAIAEMEKLLENIFRSVNIALVNELAQLCDRIGVNIWEVVDSASTKPFGFMPFYPGPGIGGHCILIDPYYLSWMAREYDFETNFITLAAEVNESMPFYVRTMIIKEIANQPITLKNAKILILGMAFKKDVDDLRHSPALKVAELLKLEGINNIKYYDPFIPKIDLNGTIVTSEKELNSELIKSSDIVVITTDHTCFDYNFIAENATVVIDTRNACRNISKRDNIVLLGDGK